MEAPAMAEIVNLRRARKDKKRADKARTAAENRTKFGRTKAERQRDERDAARTRREFDGKRLDEDQD